MSKQYELKISVPDGCRTDGEWAIVVYEDVAGPDIRQIGFCREHSGEVEEPDYLDE